MVAYQHPSELNPLQLYRQASSVLRGTSRATNDAWYTNPLELEFQIHLRIDGSQLQSWIYRLSTKKWTSGPDLPEELILDPTKVPAFAAEVVALARKAGVKSAGFVLHIADEFATAELKPELDNPGALSELRETVAYEPKAVLDDASLSLDEHSWRLIPYPAAGSEAIATAVTLSRHAADFLDALRRYGESKNFPLITRAISAPLVALLALPALKSSANDRSFLAVLPYSRFTVLAFFNEHGDLRLLRTLQHRGQKRPSNLRHATAATAAAMEMDQPEVFILPLAGEADPQFLRDLQIVFEKSEIHECKWEESPYQSPTGSEIPPELLIATHQADDPKAPLASSHTFTTLRSDGWATQDFLPIDPVTAEIYPSRQEMKLLQAAKYTRFGLAIVTLLALVWVAFGLLNMIRQPEWTFKESDAKAVSNRLATLGIEKKKIEHWDNLLDDRSKGWTSMEMLTRLFPNGSGFLIKSFTHSTSPENVPGQPQAGFVKEWRINGLAREDALEKLSDLSTREGISNAFTEIAEITGNQSFVADLPSRSLAVNIRTHENSAYKSMPPDQMTVADENSYPFMFDLTITQRFEASDPMAIIVSKAP